MAGILTYHPFKGIFTLLFIFFNLGRFPLWLVYYLPPSLRPDRRWSLRQCIGVQIVRQFLWNAALAEMKTPLSLAPRAEKEKFEVIAPADKTLYTRVAIADPSIKPTSLGATWYPAKPSVTGKPGTVILHFHGGAFVIGDGRHQDAGFAAKTLLRHTEASHVFAPQYRLSSNPDGHFPAALQDAITAYAHLVKKQGISPSRIVLSGDSAGANLVLSLTRYLTENGSSLGLEPPLAALLWSPWVSPIRSLTPEVTNASPNLPTDYITAPFGQWGAKTYQPKPHSGLTLDSEYINFRDEHFKTPVRLFVSAGEDEVLYHDIVVLVDGFKKAGNEVQLEIEEYAPHDIILAGNHLGFAKEAAKAAARAGKFLKGITQASGNGTKL